MNGEKIKKMKKEIKMKTNLILNLINPISTKILMRCTSTDISRFQLDGIVLENNGIAYATDGKVLACCLNHHNGWELNELSYNRIIIRNIKQSLIKPNRPNVIEFLNDSICVINHEVVMDFETEFSYPDIDKIMPRDNEFDHLTCIGPRAAEIQKIVSKHSSGPCFWLTTGSATQPYVLLHDINDLIIITMPQKKIQDASEWKQFLWDNPGLNSYKSYKNIKEKNEIE